MPPRRRVRLQKGQLRIDGFLRGAFAGGSASRKRKLAETAADAMLSAMTDSARPHEGSFQHGPSSTAERRAAHTGSYWAGRSARLRAQQRRRHGLAEAAPGRAGMTAGEQAAVLAGLAAAPLGLEADAPAAPPPAAGAGSGVFSGVRAYITGRTACSASHLSLSDTIAAGGGTLLPAFTRTSVTHVICGGGLAASKHDREARSAARKGASGVCFVTGQWVLDCAAEGRLLPVRAYATVLHHKGTDRAALQRVLQPK